MPSSHNAKLVSHIDCPGGGQVWVDGNILYIGHMEAPSGTSIVDIADPPNPSCSRASTCRRAGTRTRCAPRTAS